MKERIKSLGAQIKSLKAKHKELHRENNFQWSDYMEIRKLQVEFRAIHIYRSIKEKEFIFEESWIKEKIVQYGIEKDPKDILPKYIYSLIKESL